MPNMATRFIPHDDGGREQYPVVCVLQCCDCGRKLTIRTVSVLALRRTATRNGWTWIDWPVDCTAKHMSCPQCLEKTLRDLRGEVDD